LNKVYIENTHPIYDHNAKEAIENITLGNPYQGLPLPKKIYFFPKNVYLNTFISSH